MARQNSFTRPRTSLVIGLLAVSGGAAALLTYVFYRSQLRSSFEEQSRTLATIADGKTETIAAWLRERSGDAHGIPSPALSRSVRDYLAGSESTGRELRAYFQQQTERHDYAAVILYDASGQQRLSFESAGGSGESRTPAGVLEAVKSNRVVFVDLHNDANGAVHVTWVAPIRDDAGKSVAALAFLVDPRRFLYPQIQNWPTPSSSAETLMVRREGSDLVFLNELRHRKGGPLSLRLPARSATLPAARAAAGFEGVMEGIDYRGEPVLAALRRIPDSPWFLVAKIDRTEAYSGVRTRTQFFASVAVLSISLCGLYVLAWSSRRETRHYRQLYQSEAERKLLAMRYESLHRHANDVILLFDEQGRISDANERATQVYGYSYEELLRLSVRDLRDTADSERLHREWRHAESPEGVRFEATHLRADGSRVPVEVSSRAIQVDGRTYRQSIIRDITERKRSEQALRDSEERFRRFSAMCADGVAIHDEARILDANDSFARLFGYEPEEVVGKSPVDFVAAEFRTRAAVTSGANEEEPYEAVGVRKDGSRMPVRFWGKQITYQGRQVRIGVVHDLTDRKRAEQALRESEQRFRAAFDQAATGMVLISTDGVFRSVNDSFCRMSGYPREELLGKRFQELTHPEDRAAGENVLQTMAEGRAVRVTLEMRYVRKDGSLLWGEVAIAALRDDDRATTGFVTQIQDITERKAAQLALQEKSARLEELTRALATSHAIVRTPDSVITYWSEGAWKLYGWAQQEALGLRSHDLLRTESDTPLEEIDAILLATGEWEGELRHHTSAGRPLVVASHWSLLRAEDGRPVAVVELNNDITRQRVAEAEMRRSQERLEFATSAAHIGVWSWTPGADEMVVSANWRQLFCVAPDVEVTFDTWRNALHPDDRHRTVGELKTAADTARDFDMEYRVVWADGTVRWIVDRGRASYDEAGRTVSMAGINVDITERKRTEQALRSSEELLRERVEEFESLMDVAPVAIWVTKDPRCDAITGNRTANLFYVAVEGENVSANVTAVRRYFRGGRELAPFELPMQEAAARNADVRDTELDVLLPNGDWMYILGSAIPLRDPQGQVRGCVGAFVDITGRRRAEEALRESEERFRALVEQASDAFFLHDKQGRFVDVNQEACESLGYSREELLDLSVFDVEQDFDRGEAFEAWQRIQPGRASTLYGRQRRKDGSVFPAEARISICTVGDERLYLWLVRDITERQRMEQALRDSEDRYRSLFESMQEGFALGEIVCDDAGKPVDWRYLDVNPVFERMVGEGRERVLGRSGREVAAEAWSEHWVARLGQVALTGIAAPLENYTDRGGRLYEAMAYSPRRGQFAAVFSDVTERREAEEALSRQKQQYEALAENAPEVIARFDSELRHIYLNNYGTSVYGLDKAEVLGKTNTDLGFPADKVEFWEQHFHEVLTTGKQQTVNFEFDSPNLGHQYLSALFVPEMDARGRVASILAITRDVTEQRRGEEALKRSEARLQTALEHLGEGVVLATQSGELVYWNSAARRMHGFDDSEARLGPLSDIAGAFALRTADTHRLLSFEEWPLSRLMRGEEVRGVELRLCPCDQGWERVISYTGAALETASSERLLFISVFDLTEQRKAEQALRDSEERLRLAQEVAGIGSFEWNLETGVNTWTAELERIYGLEPAAFAGHRPDWEALVHPEDRAAAARLIARSLESGAPVEGEWRVLWPDQTVHWVLGRWQAFKDRDGRPRRLTGVNIDITGRKEAQQAIKASEERYRALFESIREGFLLGEMVADESGRPVDWRFLDVNPALASMFRLKREELVGHTYRELFPTAPWQYWVENFATVARTGAPARLEHYGGASKRHYDAIVYSPLPGTFAAIMTDISDRKQAEEALRESEERFRAMADNIAQFAWMADPEGRPFWFNRRWHEYTGTTLEQTRGWGWMTVHHPNHVERVVDLMQRSACTGEEWEDTFPLRGRDGRYRWFLSRAVPIRDATGQVIRWFGTNTDITDRLNAEERLREALAEAEEGRLLLNTMMEHIPLGIAIADAPDGRVRLVSRYGQDLLQRSVNEMVGIAADEYPARWDIYHPDSPTLADAGELPLTRAIRSGELIAEEEWVIRRKDGFLIPIICTAAPIRSRDGAITGGVIGWQDISQRKAAELRILELNNHLDRRLKDLEVALAEKNVLLKEVQHRVKNNLQVISSLLSLQAEESGGREQSALAESRDRVRSMALVYEQLCYSGHMAEIDFGQYVNSLVTGVLASYGAAGRRVRVDLAVDVILGLREAIPCGLITQELLSNSLKHAFPDGRGGEIRLSLHRTGNQLTLDYRDNGVGFAESLDIRRASSLGLQLISDLSLQLRGVLTFSGSEGAHFTLTFGTREQELSTP